MEFDIKKKCVTIPCIFYVDVVYFKTGKISEICLINQFQANIPFRYFFKISNNQAFSEILREYRKETWL